MKIRIMILFSICFVVAACPALSACMAVQETQPVPESETSIAEDIIQSENSMEQANGESGEAEKTAPTKDEVMAMRSVVLEGMSEDDIARLTENIKVANLVMESAYLNNDLFGKLSDANSPYWQYFDKVGEIQLGWWYNQTIVDKEVILKQEGITESEFDEEVYPPGMGYNRFDAANFIALMEEMQSFVQNEALKADLQQLIDLTYMAQITHEMEYANQVYKILHDLDYFLLRYGIEDVGKYTSDLGTVSNYYGVLTVYGATPFQLNETNSYNIIQFMSVDSDWTTYGKMEMIHEEFVGEEGSVNFYYDMECFYFDDDYPEVLNERLQEYYDSVEESYLKDAQVYTKPFEDNYDTPYNHLIFQFFTYIGEDYVSLVYNDVSYMGGAHPYSSMKGITIDCASGDIVSAQQFLADSDEIIGEHLQAVLGMDSASMDAWEFYLTKTSVVFFYYDPKYWDSVAVRRER